MIATVLVIYFYEMIIKDKGFYGEGKENGLKTTMSNNRALSSEFLSFMFSDQTARSHLCTEEKAWPPVGRSNRDGARSHMFHGLLPQSDLCK